VKIRAAEEIIFDIKSRYDVEPSGWNVLRGRDNRGHYDTYISQGQDHLWRLKTEFKRPGEPIGVGVRLTGKIDDDIKKVLREGEPLPFGEMYRTIEGGIIAFGIGRFSQRGTDDLKGILSSKQDELEVKMNQDLDRLLKREDMLKEFM